MNAEMRREIYQLLYAIGIKRKRLAGLVGDAGDQADKPMNQFSSQFDSSEPNLEKAVESCVELCAELSDISVRLTTIEERLGRCGFLTDRGALHDVACTSKPTRSELEVALKRQLPQVLHVLLRDNIAHVEPIEGGKPYWQARQSVLREITLRNACKMVTETVDRITARVKKLL